MVTLLSVQVGWTEYKMAEKFIVEYSTKDIMELLSKMNEESQERDTAQDKKLQDIHTQTLKTNGRMNNVESKSIGIWIGNNPIKFVGIILVVISLLGLQAADVVKAFIGI